MEFVNIPSGSYEMGSEERVKDSSHGPIQNVTVSSFYMMTTTVTQKMWKEVMGITIHQRRDRVDPDWALTGEGDNFPMYFVSWNEAQNFIKNIEPL
jgi:formylglycine-generating enzyme required for sulfatase activity